MSLKGRQWIWPEQNNDELALSFAYRLGLNQALARLLINRGITDHEEARAFLYPSTRQLHSPWLMRGVEEAVTRLLAALDKDEKIMIHGDYDADGIAATAILTETLEQLGANVDYYLPSRFGEGYGLHKEPLKKFKEEGVSLVVTVDCGINASTEVEYAYSLGLDLVITDHHQPLQELQGVTAVLNPHQEKCPYPFKELSGAGVAFKLACALMERSGCSFPEHLLDLVALGTAADVVPLLDENRVLVHTGLAVLRQGQRPGFKALREAVSLERERISSGALSFILAPSVNAVGRMGEALPAAKLLLEKDPARATELAYYLHEANQLRRSTEQNILIEAETSAETMLAEKDYKIITLADEKWHHGVIGIVASRLVEKYNRPVCLVALEGEEGRGSARSIPGFDITAALAEYSSLLERFGGHEQAAGFAINPRWIEELREGLNDYAEKHLDANQLRPYLHIDAELEHSDLRFELVEQIEQLQPFGTANPAPIFGSCSWELKSWRLVGADQKHLKLNLQKNGRTLTPIVFSGAPLLKKLEKGRLVDLAFKLKEGFYRDQRTLETEVKDLSYSDNIIDGRLEIIDWRGCRNRFDRAKEIAANSKGNAVLFASTAARAAKLESSCPQGSRSMFVTSSVLSGNIEIPADKNPLILYDLPLFEGLLAYIIKGPMQAKALTIYLLYGKEDLQRNYRLLDLSLPSEQQLLKILEAYEKVEAEDQSPLFPEAVKDCLEIDAAPTFWKRAADIFSEAGLLEDGRLAPGRVELKKDWPACIEKSATYQATTKLRKDCEQFQKMLLEAPPGEIASFFHQHTAGC